MSLFNFFCNSEKRQLYTHQQLWIIFKTNDCHLFGGNTVSGSKTPIFFLFVLIGHFNYGLITIYVNNIF